MAGYIFSLDKKTNVGDYLQNGVYSTNLSVPKKNSWQSHHEGTFADYFSMKEGDNVYFFQNRKIYGVGELINIGDDCKYLNYPGADVPKIPEYKLIKGNMLYHRDKNSINNRCLCIFTPAPAFFQKGIDMDEILSFSPKSFRMLRAFWKKSFIKIDEEENRALKNIILKRNEEYIYEDEGKFNLDISFHEELKSKIGNDYLMKSENILNYAAVDDKIKHEMAIEASIVDIIANNDTSLFGKWDYVSHQVIASPFKPVDYMDKMDVFGYKFISGYDVVSKYLLIEIKKDKADCEAIDQVMKYVDWINQEYAYGDYSMINAFLVASEFPPHVINYKNIVCRRNYTIGRRPIVPAEWTDIKLIKYSYDGNTESIQFKEIR
ncbi:TPA: DUF91 domain-containing protein [Bacillus wiedmannii]|uniref:endonuclease NucS domain-containing protein n=1 Tax=Bacillus TaxID=1386 RepID=UPI000BF92651|nr:MULTISPECIES: endonuclease NucS domain-containing protein [Bacillus]PGC19745.1 hypothetical protein COM08_09185 [Bacillus wiedmannii]PGE28724.1 hypothetical protein COM52_21940 [Bacillus wiedmannii]PHA37397.1 hypothetical protein COF06_19450 [Bacillus wiedmannii]HDR7868389.1 DUF91 domain-containing protein [Bacillus wiedmannii]